jgi:hypothetical protein
LGIQLCRCQQTSLHGDMQEPIEILDLQCWSVTLKNGFCLTSFGTHIHDAKFVGLSQPNLCSSSRAASTFESIPSV